MDRSTHNIDVWSTSEGDVTFAWPKKLSKFDAELLLEFLPLVRRSMERTAELTEKRRAEERFSGFDSVIP
jgi:hypothetical protein